MATSRQSQIRAVLTNDYRQGASNDALIARYQAEMRTLVHRHVYPLVKIAIALGVPVTCKWCGRERVR